MTQSLITHPAMTEDKKQADNCQTHWTTINRNGVLMMDDTLELMDRTLT